MARRTHVRELVLLAPLAPNVLVRGGTGLDNCLGEVVRVGRRIVDEEAVQRLASLTNQSITQTSK